MSDTIIRLTSSNTSQLDHNLEIIELKQDGHAYNIQGLIFFNKDEIEQKTNMKMNTFNTWIGVTKPTSQEIGKIKGKTYYSLNFLTSLFNSKGGIYTNFLTFTRPEPLTNDKNKDNETITKLNLKVNELEKEKKQIIELKENQLNLNNAHILSLENANLTLTKANNDLNDRVKELIQNNDSLTKAITNSQSLQLQTQMALKDALELKNLLPQHIEESKQAKIEERKKFLGIF